MVSGITSRPVNFTNTGVLPEKNNPVTQAALAALVSSACVAALASEAPPEPIQAAEVPKKELATCTLMGTEIPAKYELQIGNDFFDMRYFVKAMLTQKQPVSPYTRDTLEPEILEKICKALKMDVQQFEAIWEGANLSNDSWQQLFQWMNLFTQEMNLSRQIAEASARNDTCSVTRLVQSMERLIAEKDEFMNPQKARTEKLMKHLKALDSDFSKGFQEILRGEE